MSKKYRIKRDFETPTFTIKSGTEKSVDFWINVFPQLQHINLDNMTIWFEEVISEPKKERIDVQYVESCKNGIELQTGTYLAARSTLIRTNLPIPEVKMPAVKAAIEFTLNNEPHEVKLGDYTFKFQEVPTMNQDNPKPDLVDDVLDGGLKEMYNMGIDHAAAEVWNYYSGEGSINKDTTETLIRLIKALKK